MKLKYNLIAWSLLGFFAAACDPMDDIYNEIDAEGTTNTQTMAEYVLHRPRSMFLPSSRRCCLHGGKALR